LENLITLCDKLQTQHVKLELHKMLDIQQVQYIIIMKNGLEVQGLPYGNGTSVVQQIQAVKKPSMLLRRQYS
jgi:hypothetical protein